MKPTLRTLSRAFLGLVALFAAGPNAWSESRPAPLRTEILTVEPPPGWVMSVWNGGMIEFAEFTPPGQTRGRYVDLLGYSVLPKVAGVRPETAAGLPAFSLRHKSAGCRQERRFERQHLQDWYSAQSLCIGAKGAPSDELILLFEVQRVGRQGVFRIWREWRGSPFDFAAMLKTRTGESIAPVAGGAKRASIDDDALARAIDVLAPVFVQDLARHEICDVGAPESCKALQGDLPPESVARLRGGFIGGFYGAGLGLLPREEFRKRFNVTAPDDGSPNRVFAVVEPNDLNWFDSASVDRVVMIVGTGIVSDGGSLVASDPDRTLSVDELAQVRAQVIMSGRRLWREGYPTSIISFRLSPPD